MVELIIKEISKNDINERKLALEVFIEQFKQIKLIELFYEEADGCFHFILMIFGRAKKVFISIKNYNEFINIILTLIDSINKHLRLKVEKYSKFKPIYEDVESKFKNKSKRGKKR